MNQACRPQQRNKPRLQRTRPSSGAWLLAQTEQQQEEKNSRLGLIIITALGAGGWRARSRQAGAQAAAVTAVQQPTGSEQAANQPAMLRPNGGLFGLATYAGQPSTGAHSLIGAVGGTALGNPTRRRHLSNHATSLSIIIVKQERG